MNSEGKTSNDGVGRTTALEMKRPGRLARWVVAWLILTLATVARGAEPAPLVVGTYLDPPFVQNTDGRLTGFSVELWEAIALRLQQPFTWRTFDTVPEMLAAVRTGAVDVVVADLSITSERCAAMDFSHPFYESGLRVMIPDKRYVGLHRLWHNMADAGHLLFYGRVLVALLVVTLLVMLVERRFNREFPRAHPAAFAESLYHVVSVLLKGQTSQAPIPGVWGRLLAIFWMTCGVTVVSYVTATVASEMTVLAIQQQIHGPADLAHKAVGTLPGTTAEWFLLRGHLASQSYPDLSRAIAALANHRIDAIVYDAPVLEDFDRRHPEVPVTVVGPVFDPQEYGFAFPLGSPLRRAVNAELLRLKETGAYDRLRAACFGNTRE